MVNYDLRARRILVVEDEYAIAMSLQDYFVLEGAEVVGPVSSVAEGLNAIETNSNIDVAVVDIKLGNTLAYPLAERLLSRGIPFVFASAYDPRLLSDRYPQIRNVQKPYLMQDLIRALAFAISGDCGGCRL